jgi:excisionase family DNA binding protein
MTAATATAPTELSTPHPDRTPGRLLTAAEVAERLRVTTGWVYAATRANRLPHVRLGRYVRFRAGAIERWIAEVEQRGTVPAELPH